MPYCPKCDMEFVEGITVCTDCGGPLVESKEAAEALKKEQDARQEEEMRRRYEELLKAEAETEAEDSGEAGSTARKPAAPARAYVNKSQRYEDMRSSASAFFLVGGVLAVAVVLCLTGVINLPMAGASKYIFEGLMALMAVGSILVAVSSKKSAGVLKTEASDEQQETDEIISWFLKTYSGDDLDDQLLSEDPDLSGEELDLKRFELIQDYLITGRDIPDQSYVDALCEMIYGRLYDKK